MTQRLSPASIMLGFATGLRSSLGMAALALTGDNRGQTVLTSLAAVGELAADKSARVPSRLTPAPLTARLLTGAGVGVLLGRRSRVPRGVLPFWAVTGLAGAAAGSFAGARWRGFAAQRFGRDLPGALIEDAIALLLAGSGARTGLRAQSGARRLPR